MRLHKWKSILILKEKKTICCCAYRPRDPDVDASKFIDYMESNLSKIESKNKKK